MVRISSTSTNVPIPPSDKKSLPVDSKSSGKMPSGQIVNTHEDSEIKKLVNDIEEFKNFKSFWGDVKTGLEDVLTRAKNAVAAGEVTGAELEQYKMILGKMPIELKSIQKNINDLDLKIKILAKEVKGFESLKSFINRPKK